MSGQRPHRRPWRRSPGRLLLLVALMAGVFAMHGFQVTAGPVEGPGIPHAAVQHDRHAHDPAPASCGDCDGHGSGGHGNGHDHPGGQVCLGLLALGSIIAMLAGSARRHGSLTLARALARRLVRPPAGRPPPRPDIYRLAVLRQ